MCSNAANKVFININKEHKKFVDRCSIPKKIFPVAAAPPLVLQRIGLARGSPMIDEATNYGKSSNEWSSATRILKSVESCPTVPLPRARSSEWR